MIVAEFAKIRVFGYIRVVRSDQIPEVLRLGFDTWFRYVTSFLLNPAPTQPKGYGKSLMGNFCLHFTHLEFFKCLCYTK